MFNVYYAGQKINDTSYNNREDAATFMLVVNGMINDSDRPGMVEKKRTRHHKLAELHRWDWSIKEVGR